MTTRVLLTASVVALSLAPAAHASTKSCGNLSGTTYPRQVTASGTTCTRAKKVARAHLSKQHPYGYNCTNGHARKNGTFKVSCRRPGKLVTFIDAGRG